MTRRRLAPLVLAVVVALAAAACGGGGDDSSAPDTEPPSEPVRGGTLIYGLGAETSGWDPTNDRWGTAGNEVAKAIFDPLAAYDADYGVHPYLAEAIEPNDDDTEWTITTRDGVVFHDGEPCDAAAIARNLGAYRDSPLTGPALQLVESVEVRDERTVVVTMSEPWAHFPEILTGQGGSIAAPSMLDDPDGASHPVGTGPFELDEWIPDKHLRVTAFDDYWRDGYPYLDGIEFRPITDNDSRYQTFEAGDLDVNPTAVAGQIAELRTQADAGEVQLFVDEDGESLENFVLLNTAVPPFDDERVRRALALATDKDALVDTVFDGEFQTADGLFTPQSRWYTEVDAVEYDPDAAQELVDEYEAENGPIEFDYLGTSRVEDVQIRSFLKEQWKAVGIDANLVDLEAATHLVRVVGGDYQATNFANFTSPHPDSDYHFLHSVDPCEVGDLCLNLSRWEDGQLDQALDTARASRDPEVVKEQYAIVNERLAEGLPFVFLWHSLDGLAAHNEVRDVVDWTLPDGQAGLPLLGVIHPLYQIWLTDGAD